MGWVKYFYDGTSYVATDKDIATRVSSWRNSRFEGLQRVDIFHDESPILSLSGIGEFWQSDTMEAPVGGEGFHIVKRRVQKRITSRDIIATIETQGDALAVNVHYLLPASLIRTTIPLRARDIGKWLTLEYDVVSGNKRHYLSDVRI